MRKIVQRIKKSLTISTKGWLFSPGCQKHPQKARKLTEQVMQLAIRLDDPACQIEGHRLAGGDLFFSGEIVPAIAHFEEAVSLYYARQDQARTQRYVNDSAVSCLPWIALGLWLLGYPEQAVQRSHEVVALARQLASPLYLSFALTWTAFLHLCRREEQASLERVEELFALSTERGLTQLLAISKLFHGAILAAQGGGQGSLTQMYEALDLHQSTGARLHRVCFYTLLAQACGQAQETESGLKALSMASALAEQTEERYYEAELHRLKGQLLLQQSSANQSEAESCFHKALDVAQHQSARSWELRAATSLARLWQSQGKRQDAYDLLALVYNWFTEGFDTADLQDAKALLEALS
jgi:predicted ATPase